MVKAFILGNPRSGTSLLRLMLNSHPEIAAPPECGFLQWWHDKYKSWNEDSGRSAKDIREFVDDLLTSRKVETWELNRDELAGFLLNQCPASYGELGALVYEYWARRSDRNPQAIVDKNNYYIRHLSELSAIWPDARFIHLVRDGRDVACSYKDVAKLESNSPYKPVLPESVDEIAREWNDNNWNITSFLEHLPRKTWTRIRYEDLVVDPGHALREAVSLLDVPFSERMLKYYDFNDEPASTLDWKRKTLESPDPTTIGRFRKVLSREEVSRFQQIAGDMLNAYGYGERKV